MSDYLKDILSSGKRILADTKQPRKTEVKTADGKKKPVPAMDTPTESDPHKNFIKRTIQEKPKQKAVVEEIKKFIKSAEDDL